jgi:hypothetical protein
VSDSDWESVTPWPPHEDCDAVRAERDQLRAWLSALVNKLPSCGFTRGNQRCGKPATYYEVSAGGCSCCGSFAEVESRCDEHGKHQEEAEWAAPLRRALELLK